MRLFYLKENPGAHGAYRFADHSGPCSCVALFKTERDARRFIDAGNRSLSVDEEKQVRENPAHKTKDQS